MEQLDVKTRFENGNAFADERGGNAELVRRGYERTQPRRGTEYAEVFKERQIVHES
jgi:hypothetical protein